MTWYVDPVGPVAETCRVVVVGAGAGGAFVALTLAQAGLDVVLVEDGYHFAPSGFAPELGEVLADCYAEGGMRTMQGAPPIPLPGGRGLGGSTLVNSAICFRTPRNVVDDWNEQTDGAFADVDEFYREQDGVEAMIGVRRTPDELLSGNDRAQRQAARAMGWAETNLRRNTPGCQGCQRCNSGCPVGGKGSVDRSVLPLAAAAGARIYTGCRVDTLTPNRVAGPVITRDGARVGDFEVKADVVVLCAGAVSTPRLLLDLGLVDRGGPVGRGLQVHPVLGVHAQLPGSWYSRGATQGHVVTEFADEEVIFESNPVIAGAIFQALPLVGRPLQEALTRCEGYVSSGALIRDKSTGRVRTSLASAAARVTYKLNRHDRDRFVKAGRRLARMWFEGMGAEWVLPAVYGAPLCRDMDEFRRALSRDVGPERLIGYASHPQSTCAIGRATDQDGQLLELPGVYCMDASALPTNVGRNPQVTVMTVARLLAAKLARRLGGAVKPLPAPVPGSP